jgi:hypothetical protein
MRERESQWTWWTHTGGGGALDSAIAGTLALTCGDRSRGRYERVEVVLDTTPKDPVMHPHLAQLHTLGRFLGRQAMGVATGSHGPFKGYSVEALTLSTVGYVPATTCVMHKVYRAAGLNGATANLNPTPGNVFPGCGVSCFAVFWSGRLLSRGHTSAALRRIDATAKGAASSYRIESLVRATPQPVRSAFQWACLPLASRDG